jgi:hypothetical protein
VFGSKPVMRWAKLSATEAARIETFAGDWKADGIHDHDGGRVPVSATQAGRLR